MGAGYLRVGDSRLYVEECGSGAAIDIVLLHDGLLHSVTWDDMWPTLCARHHVVRYDRRGYGRSDPATAAYAPEDDLLGIMEKTRMKRAILVGNSSGAGLALDFALAHPDRVQGLFLIGPVVHGMPSSAYFLARGARMSAPTKEGTAENWSRDPYLIAGPDPAARQEILAGLRASPQNLTSGGRYARQPSPPTVLRLSHIDSPTLILVGDHDIADVIAYAGAIEAALPIVSFEVWKDAGHMIQLQQPAQLAARLDRFVALAARPEARVPDRKLLTYAGEFRFGERTIGISFRKDRLWLRLPDFPEKPLFAASPDRFFVRTTGTEFEFMKNASGKLTELVVHNPDGATIRCPLVTAATGKG